MPDEPPGQRSGIGGVVQWILISIGLSLALTWGLNTYNTQRTQSGITANTYNSITQNTTEQQFLNLVGSFCEKSSEVPDPQFYSVGYSCLGKGKIGANAQFSFSQGKMSVKAQTGLTN